MSCPGGDEMLQFYDIPAGALRQFPDPLADAIGPEVRGPVGDHWEQLCLPGTSAHPSGVDPCSAYPGTEYYYVNVHTGEVFGPNPVMRDVDSPGLALPSPPPPAGSPSLRLAYAGRGAGQRALLYLDSSVRRARSTLLSRCPKSGCWPSRLETGHVVWRQDSSFYSYGLGGGHHVLRWRFHGADCGIRSGRVDCPAITTPNGIMMRIGKDRALYWAQWGQ